MSGNTKRELTLETLWQAIKDHDRDGTFWIVAILLDTIKRETGYNGEKLQ